jgi:CubicO group peptidase (beta-lactamase class C family)
MTVDAAGFAFANGGLSTTLRDLARFGQLMLNGGGAAEHRATPARWATRHREQIDRGAVAGSEFASAYPNGSYSTKWWCTGDTAGTFYGVGIYGQFLWIVPKSSLVIVKFSSLPRALDPAVTADHHRAFRSLAAAIA